MTPIRSLAAFGATAVVLGSAWAFGSVEPVWFAAASALILGLAAVALAASAVEASEPLPRDLCLLMWALPVTAALTLVPLPQGLRAALGPGSAELLDRVTPGGSGGWRPVSLDPRDTWNALTVAAAVSAVFWLVARGALHGPVAAGLRALAVAGGVVLAGYGLYDRAFHGDPSLIFGSLPLPEVGTPFGPFVNRNHFAGAMLLFLGLSAGGMLATLARRRRAGAAAFGGATLLIAAALAATTSRGAVLGVGGFAGVLLLATPGARRRKAILSGVAALVVIVVILWSVGAADEWISRFVTDPVRGRWSNRFLVQADALRLFAGHPLLGTGAGTFEAAYPPFQSVDDARHFSDAHSDWAQFLAETGLAGVGLAALGAMVLARRLRFAVRSAAPGRWLVIGPMAGFVGVAVHGLVETNLHVPSNSLLMALALSLGSAAALQLREPASCAVPGPGSTADAPARSQGP